MQAEPTEAAIRKVAEYFNVSTDYLLGRTDELGAVVAGAQGGPSPGTVLSADEQELLADYRSLRKDLQELLRSTAATLASASAPMDNRAYDSISGRTCQPFLQKIQKKFEKW